jgi:uncharacterized membrane protein YeaQ/YmgE (transglycosylase-associated protein family)
MSSLLDPLTPAPPARAGQPPPRLGDGRHAPPAVLGHPPRPRDQIAVGAGHLPVGQVEVVLEPDAHVAAERERGRHQRPLVARDADHAPFVRHVGDLLGHVREVARRRPDPARHAHHARDLQRRLQRAHVQQRVEVGQVARVEALVLGPDPALVHGVQQRADRVEAVLEHQREHELLAPARVLRVVHRAHVQRADVRPQLAQVGDPLLDRHADRARGVVDDHVAGLGQDRLGDRAEVLDLIGRRAVRRAGVDVDHRAALVDDPPGLGRVLLRRVRDRRALVPVGDRARDRAGEDHGVVEAHAAPGKWDVPLLTLKDRAASRNAALGSPSRHLQGKDHSMIGTIIAAIVIGIIAGYLGRLLLPGPDPMGFVETVIVGIVGALLGWALFTYVLGIGDTEKFDLGGVLGAIVGTMLVLLLLRAVRGRGTGTGTGTPARGRV